MSNSEIESSSSGKSIVKWILLGVVVIIAILIIVNWNGFVEAFNSGWNSN